MKPNLKKPKVSLKTTLIFLVFFGTVVPISIVGILGYQNATTSVEQENLTRLEIISDLKAEKIQETFSDIQLDIQTAKNYNLVKINLPILAKFFDDRENPEYVDAKQTLDSNFEPFYRSKLIYNNVMLVNLEGNIVYVTNPESEELILGNPLPDPLGISFQDKKDIYISDVFINPVDQAKRSMLMTAPIESENGNLIGMIAYELDMNFVYDLIIDRTGLGNTGETILAKKIGDDSVILSPLRHEPPTLLNKKIHLGEEIGIPIQEAVQKRQGSGLALDYRSEPVIAVWRYIPLLEWGMVTKIDTVEAFQPIENLSLTVLITVMFVSSVFIIGSYWLLRKKITNPLLNLKKATEKIGRGDYDIKTRINSDDEIGILAKSFENMASTIKKHQVEKDEFVSMVTHELKTPLTPIQGFCYLLKNPKVGNLNIKQLNAVNEIESNSITLLNLINNLLTAQKLEMNIIKFEKEEIQILDFMKNIYESFLPIMLEKKIEFINSTDKDLLVISDKPRLKEIFINLIQNSIDFLTDKNAKIEIGAQSPETENDVIFYVKDNGIGITKEKQDKIFGKFYQADKSPTRKHGGAGLGLAICKGYVEGLGGRIWFESEESFGTTFYFSLLKPNGATFSRPFYRKLQNSDYFALVRPFLCSR